MEVSLSAAGRQFIQTRPQKLSAEQHSVLLLAHAAACSCGNNGLSLQQETPVSLYQAKVRPVFMFHSL